MFTLYRFSHISFSLAFHKVVMTFSLNVAWKFICYLIHPSCDVENSYPLAITIQILNSSLGETLPVADNIKLTFGIQQRNLSAQVKLSEKPSKERETFRSCKVLMKAWYRLQQVQIKLQSQALGCPSSLEKEACGNKSLHAKILISFKAL